MRVRTSSCDGVAPPPVLFLECAVWRACTGVKPRAPAASRGPGRVACPFSQVLGAPGVGVPLQGARAQVRRQGREAPPRPYHPEAVALLRRQRGTRASGRVLLTSCCLLAAKCPSESMLLLFKCLVSPRSVLGILYRYTPATPTQPTLVQWTAVPEEKTFLVEQKTNLKRRTDER